MHYLVYAVEPLPSHPKFYEMQAGYAHVMVRDVDDPKVSDSLARRELEALGMKIQELQNARLIPVERYEKIPPDFRAGLALRPIHIQIVGYKTGGGPEKPTAFSLEDDE